MTSRQAEALRHARIRADFDDDIPARFADLRNGGNLPPEPSRMEGVLFAILVAWLTVAVVAAVVLGG